jgi:CheY-like chemotaxis protein
MGADSIKALFVHELRKALPALYDPGALRRSPLTQFFGTDQRGDEISALQRVVTEAIEALKPVDSVPAGSNAWRVYWILYYRYVDQFTQREVAADLALSPRQLRRQEKVAQEVLADYLWTHYNLEEKASLLGASGKTGGDDISTEGMPSREQELEWLKRTLPNEPLDVRQTVEAVLETVHPLMGTSRVHVSCHIPEDLPALSAPLTAVRQALLHVITLAAYHVPGGQVNIAAETLPRRIYARISITAHRAGSSVGHIKSSDDENLEMAQQLIQVAGGSLEVKLDDRAEAPLMVNITLPTAEQVAVLVIDDNVDTLQLMQRYLSNSRYRFIGTSDPQEGLALAEQLVPAIIVLDVMLPGVDGWELLGRLREHPKTSAIPVIVCTILPQRPLALTLGAAEFIRKPVSQKTLLSTLDRQVDRWLTVSR